MAETPSEASGDTARGPVGMHVPGSHIQIWPAPAFLVAQWLVGASPSLSISPFLLQWFPVCSNQYRQMSPAESYYVSLI